MTPNDAPRTLVDFEIGFTTDAPPLVLTVELDRDLVEQDATALRLLLKPDPDTIEEVIVYWTSIAYLRRVQRTLHPPNPYEAPE